MLMSDAKPGSARTSMDAAVSATAAALATLKIRLMMSVKIAADEPFCFQAGRDSYEPPVVIIRLRVRTLYRALKKFFLGNPQNDLRVNDECHLLCAAAKSSQLRPIGDKPWRICDIQFNNPKIGIRFLAPIIVNG